jgi:glycosyltransferase involved in cell wall biosynthesis
MRVLFLSQVLPYPLDAGPKARSYFVLRHLAASHQVTLLTFVRDTDRPEHVAHLENICYRVHTVPMRRSRLRDMQFLAQSLLAGQPFLIMRDEMPAMTERVRQLVSSASFDLVHADQLWMAPYALAAKSASSTIKLVLDQHNAVHLIPQRLAEAESNPLKHRFLTREAHLLAQYEPQVCQRFDHVVWVTQEDRQAVVAQSLHTVRGPLAPSSVIPICADPAGVAPVVPSATRQRVTFLGGLHWPPNAQGILWFARHVFPQVRAEVPDAILTVIGKSPPPGLEGEGVEVAGYVTDLAPYLAETAAFIVPLHAGGGMRVKILDAWNWGLPVVSTTIGAEGISTCHGDNILIADTPETFAGAILRVLRDTELSRQLAQNGRRTIEEAYDWRSVYSAWDDVYNNLTDNGQQTSV